MLPNQIYIYIYIMKFRKQTIKFLILIFFYFIDKMSIGITTKMTIQNDV